MSSTSAIKVREKANRIFQKTITYKFASFRANLHPFIKFNALARFSEITAFYDESVLLSREVRFVRYHQHRASPSIFPQDQHKVMI